MSDPLHMHAMLLAMQLSSVFKHVDDVGFNRQSYDQFTTLEGGQGNTIKVNYNEGTRKGRCHVDACVNSDLHGFLFRQHFNFGILLELEISYLHESGEYRSLLKAIEERTEDESYLRGLMIEFEYCISIFTEHVANNVTTK